MNPRCVHPSLLSLKYTIHFIKLLTMQINAFFPFKTIYHVCACFFCSFVTNSLTAVRIALSQWNNLYRENIERKKNVKHLASIDLLVNHEGVLQMENHIFLLPALFSEMSTNHSHSWYHSIRGINYKILHMATFLAYLLWWFGWMCNRFFFAS